MADKNSELSNNFIDKIRLGIDQLPTFLEDILTRTTELPFVAGSDIVVEPVLRFLVPGTSEEERQRIKADIAAKDETQAAFLEGARGRILNILQLPPKSLEQGLAITQLEKDMVAIGYPKTTVMDVLNKGREFFFGDTYDVHKKVADGVIRPSELEGQDLANYFIGFVDVADVAGIGSGIVNSIRKALSRQDFGALKNIANTIPSEKAQEVSEALNKKGLETGSTNRFYSSKADETRLDKTKKIFQDGFLNLKNFAKKNKLKSNSLVTQEIADLLGIQNKQFRRQFLENAEENIGKIFTQEEYDYVMDLYAGGSKQKVALEINEKIKKLIDDVTKDPSLQNKGREFYISKYDITESSFDKKTRENPELYALTTSASETRGGPGSPGTLSVEGTNLQIATTRKVLDTDIDVVDNAIISNLYRGTKNATGHTPTQFLEEFKKQNPDFKNNRSYQNLKKEYQILENERVDLQNQAFSFFDEIFSQPEYKKYLQPGDRKQFQFHKAHAFAIADATNNDRYLNMAQMSDLIFNAPFGSNKRIQEGLDSSLRVMATLFNDNKMIADLSKTPVNISNAEMKRKFGLDISKILEKLKRNNVDINPDDYKNMQDFLFNGLNKKIDELYKSHGVGTLVPVGNNKSALIGANPKKITGEERLELLKQRTIKLLDDQLLYEKTNGSQGKPIMRDASNVIVGLSQGGDVETEQENQSLLSKAATTIGNILIPQAEALPLPKNFLLGDVPKINKKVEIKPELPAPEAPLMEKRYNIFDENGQKVYQSKSIDDAQQKALRLEDLEGKTFTVQEVEVPIKVKKSKTTKPGTALVPTVTPDTIIGSGNSKLFYSDLKGIINTDTGNLTIKGVTVPADSVSMSAKEWHDWFRSSGIKEGELYDSYVRSYLNKKGGFNRETSKFTNDQKISYAEIKELVDTSPTNYIQSVSYSDAAGNLKYGNTGRQDGSINGSRVERVLWLDSKDIRGDIGSLPDEIRRYEGHSSMRNVQSSNDFSVQNNTLNGEPYVIGWSLNSNRIGQLNNTPIIVNVADEIQSDFLQKAASLKSKIKKEIRDLVQGTNILPGGSDELDALYKRLENVFRPMPATYAQLKKSIDELLESDAIFQKIADMDMDDITKASFKELGEAAKKRDKALATINATIDDIDTRELFPNIPFKDQKDWVDAIIKNDLYHAAKARFSFDESGKLVVNQDAPAYYTVAPAKAVKAYRGGRGVELTPDNPDRSGTMVAYDMQYGGPNLNDHTGQHFTSNVEESLNKIANMKNSKVEVGQVNFGFAGEGVDTFMIELTPDMLMPYKAYKKDGGLVKKSILYTPIVSIDKILSPIGASRW